jgi:glycine/D-amino acid oxidase-like deaminating enzyme
LKSRRFDAVIIGAGAFGTSVAFHLASRGLDVALVDRRDPVSQTSPRAAGIGMQIHVTEASSRLGIESIAMVERFTADVGEPLPYVRAGSVKVARGEDHARQVAAEVEFAASIGVEAEMIDPERASELAPFLDASSAAAISFVPGDVQFEPGDLPRAYLKAAARLGVEVLARCEVTGIAVESSHATAVETTAGTFETANIVATAGGWTPRIVSMVGGFVPIVAMRHQLFVTEPIAGIEDHHSTIRVVDDNVYARPYEGGLMFGAYEGKPVEIDVRREAADYDIDNVPADIERLRASARAVARELPLLAGAEVREVRPGLPTLTTDHRYIIDRLPEAQNLIAITGCCVTGLHVSPAVGRAVADWIADGERPDSLAPFALSRFPEELRDPEQLRAAADLAYEHKYSTFEGANS